MSEQNTNLTEIEETHHLAVKQTAMERILNRALENDVDMDRLERLIALREKEIERQNYQNFVHDLSNMQIEYQKIQKNATNTHTNSQYATLDQYIDAVKDTLAKHRFALFSRIKEQSSESIIVEMTLTHPSGNKISTEGKFPHDTKGCKSNIQAVGSTLTYARRYLLGMLLNVVSEDDDTDGNPPVKSACPQQINEIRKLIEQTHAEEVKILDYVKVKQLDNMSDGQAQIVLHLLKNKQNKQMAKAEQSLPPQEQQTVV
ncbi:ERF family protein [Bartonella raoultii]|uniref:ERF family protein n=1 Tax=Bartonella raoultii TaxID=1457020 RepID=A0ABS7IBG7_9HYPH|nr:ERF family protein [Bartonella raoultii]MBX4336456.1 ERF family protein [Bartonella raoultii]